jgi:hypothetical protein
MAKRKTRTSAKVEVTKRKKDGTKVEVSKPISKKKLSSCRKKK